MAIAWKLRLMKRRVALKTVGSVLPLWMGFPCWWLPGCVSRRTEEKSEPRRAEPGSTKPEIISELGGHESFVDVIKFSRDGSCLVTGSYNQIVKF